MKPVMIISPIILLALVACSNPETPENKGEETKTPDVQTVTRDVQTFITTGDNTMHFSSVGRDFKQGFNTNIETTLYLHPETRYQEFDGFGCALNGSACYNLMRMTQENRTKLLRETFDPNLGMGYSYTRISIGTSDFSLSDYTCCDQKGIENFSLTSEETTYVIPVLKEVLAINPDLKIMGSPWTCPRWMKVNNLSEKQAFNSWTSGQLNPDYYQDYAEYFVRWIRAFEAEGIHIESVTIQNEPLNRGNSASLYMTWQECRDFVKVLGPKFEENNIKTKILVFDHNYNYDNLSDQQQYPLKIYADAEAAKYIDGAAYHNYGGSPTELDNIHKSAPDKNLYFTEHSIGTWNYFSYQESLMNDMNNPCMSAVTRWCKSVIVWNFMLDNERGPYRPGGCGTCYGLVEISNRDWATLNRRATYYVMGHLSRVLLPGSTRIDAKGYSPANLSVVAAENPDGTYGLVLQNNNDSGLSLTIDDGTHAFDLTLPAKSLTSCIWKK